MCDLAIEAEKSSAQLSTKQTDKPSRGVRLYSGGKIKK